MYLFIADIINPDSLFDVVGPGLVSTSPAFVRSSASHPEGPHGRLAQKTVYRAPKGSTQFAQQFVTAVTAPPIVGCVVWSHHFNFIIIIPTVSQSFIFMSIIPQHTQLPHCFLLHFITFYMVPFYNFIFTYAIIQSF